MKRKALGKGLSSLIPEVPPAKARVPVPGSVPVRDGLVEIDIDRIRPNPDQPRERFEEQHLAELAQSIIENGLLQPVVVRPAADGTYELIAGERRWRAAQIAGLLRIPAVVRHAKDEERLQLALVENLQREQLNPIEAAQGYQRLMDTGMGAQDIADRVGKDRSTVTNTMRLLNLPPDVQHWVRTGQLSAGHARPLLALGNGAAQIELARQVIAKDLSVREVESLVQRKLRGRATASSSTGRPALDPNVAAAQDTLQQALGTKVRIAPGRKGGRLEIRYHSGEELSRLYDLILRGARKPAR